MGGFDKVGVNGSAEKRAANGGARLEGKGKHKGVERKRGVNVVKERKSFLVTGIVDVRS